MEAGILKELSILSIITAALATLLGLLSQGAMGVLFLGFSTIVACGLCLVGFRLYGWTGLLLGIFLATLGGYFLGRMFGKRRGGLFVAFLWLGFCTSCAVGYWAAGWLGWLTISLPSVALFWYSLWLFSERILPLQIKRQPWWLLRDLCRRLFGFQLSKEERCARRHRYLAFRALVTYSLGTNYPYYIVEDGKPKIQVKGEPFGQFFAGPGLIITGPHHAAVITDGMKIKEIAPPGLAFLDMFSRVDQIVDLRTHLKAFNVEALTKDGIRIRTLTFVFFRVRPPKLPPGRFWADKESKNAVFDVMRAQPIEEGERQNWDEWVRLVAERVLQEVISRYGFDELLCADEQPDWLSLEEKIGREKIKKEFTEQLKGTMDKRCRSIEIIGAGFANLEPAEKAVMQRRVENWRTEWTRQMMAQMGEGETEAMRHIARARAQGQAEVIRILTGEAERIDSTDKDILADVLTLRLLEVLEDMACRPPVQRLLPPEATETMRYLRRSIGEGHPSKVQEPGRQE